MEESTSRPPAMSDISVGPRQEYEPSRSQTIISRIVSLPIGGRDRASSKNSTQSVTSSERSFVMRWASPKASVNTPTSLLQAMENPDSPVFSPQGGRTGWCGFVGYFILCLLATLATNAAAVLLWSDMGCGQECLRAMEDHRRYAWLCSSLALVILLTLYLLDFFLPPHIPGAWFCLFRGDKFVGRFLLALAIILLLLACLFFAKEYPTIPLAITIFFSPVSIVWIRHVTMPREEYRSHDGEVLRSKSFQNRFAMLRQLTGEEHNQQAFYRATMWAFVLSAILCLCVWTPWAIAGEDDFNRIMNELEHGEAREKKFMYWVAPLIVAVCDCIFASFAFLRVALNEAYTGSDKVRQDLVVGHASRLSRDLMTHRMAKLHQHFEEHLETAPSPQSAKIEAINHAQDKMQQYLIQHIAHTRQLTTIVKVIVSAFVVLLGGIYVAFQLTTADSHTAQLVQGFLGAYFVFFLVFTYVAFHRLWKTMHLWLRDLPFWSSALAVARSSWARALVLVVTLPLLPAVLLLSMINQAVRRCRGLGLPMADADDVEDDQASTDSYDPLGAEQGAEQNNQGLDEGAPGKASSSTVASSSQASPPSPELPPTTAAAAAVGGGVTAASADAPPHDPPSAEAEAAAAAARAAGEGAAATASSSDSRASPHSALGDAPTTASAAADRRPGLLTARVEAALAALRNWDWVTVWKFCYIFAIVLIIYKAVPPLLNVLLSWMSRLMESCSFAVILLFTFGVGMVLFMLPPVPGPPIYLFGGFVISERSPWGFWWGCTICIVLCFLLKLSACAIQQKLIGERMGHSHWVRQTCGVHKPFIRAIESVLRRPGLSFGKCVILCGGPDWPTSVLAGILRLSLAQCLLGTCPIIVNLIPLTLTGSFYLKREESEVWTRAGNLMFTLTVLTSVVFWAGMAWAIQNEFAKRHRELTAPKEEYIDLDWLDYRQAYIEKRCALSWKIVPTPVKVLFSGGALGLIVIAHLIFWRKRLFFGTFSVTDDIDELKWYGSDGMLKPIAPVALAAACLLFSGWIAFSCWSRNWRRKPAAVALEEILPQERAWKEARLEEARNFRLAPSPTPASPKQQQQQQQQQQFTETPRSAAQSASSRGAAPGLAEERSEGVQALSGGSSPMARNEADEAPQTSDSEVGPDLAAGQGQVRSVSI